MFKEGSKGPPFGQVRVGLGSPQVRYQESGVKVGIGVEESGPDSTDPRVWVLVRNPTGVG